MADFESYPKIARLSRECIITEKIDGTNAQIVIEDNGFGGFIVQAGSRNRFISPGKQTDNHGFAGWVDANLSELLKLGIGRHFGEWWGPGIGTRKYGIPEKRFSLFNVDKWGDDAVRPACCHVVPVLYRGPFNDDGVEAALASLIEFGSSAAPGFMQPEGIVIYHIAARTLFKKTLEKDEQPKGAVEA